MTDLSVVIITLNEEKNIARCLDSVKDIADDIVVIDSFSTDRTEEICKLYNVNFISRQWEGYSETKNFGNASARYDWILSLDADEALSGELRASILDLKKKGITNPCKFNRLTNYCGKWIRHCGWYPDTKLRIFNRNITKWEGVIHEELVSSVDQEVQHLRGDCLHYSYYTIADHLRQVNHFTEIAAMDLFSRGKKAGMLKILFSPCIKFIRDYFFKLGFIDGYAGFVICKISAHATFIKYVKLKQLWDQ